MGDLLRAFRVLGPVLRLMGRHRAATWISLVLACGWLVLGLAARGDAATLGQPIAYADGPAYVVPGRPEPDRPGFDGLADTLGAAGDRLAVAFAVAFGVAFAVIAVAAVHRAGALRDATGRGDDRTPRFGGRSDGLVPRIGHGRNLATRPLVRRIP